MTASDHRYTDNDEFEESTEEREDIDQMSEELQDDQDTFEDEQDVIEKLMAQRDEYLDQLQRSRAEFINYRKRTDAEKLRLGQMFTANTISQFLPVLDDWDRAIANMPEEEKDDSWYAGIAMIYKKLQGILERAGVHEVDGEGAPFDPSMHEAVSIEPGTRGDTVVEVYQKGYKLGDSLLRAAMVKTGNAAESDAPVA